MQEYNNTNSYPDSVRAAKITVNTVPAGVCDYLYGRDVDRTGKFCAGGTVDACQVTTTSGDHHSSASPLWAKDD